MKRRNITWVLFLLLAGTAPAQHVIDQYNVVWTTQSRDSSGSMPCGGGDIGLNVWVEDGDVLFYMMRSGCFDENNEFLKLGRVRISLSPNPFAPGGSFRQELKLRDGYVQLTGDAEVSARIKIWVEVFRPMVHVDIDCDSQIGLEAAYESWRTDEVSLPDDGKHSRFGCFAYDCYPGKVIRYADEVEQRDGSVLWYHRNRDDKLIFALACDLQGLGGNKDTMWNPLRGTTFGGILCGENLESADRAKGVYVITPYEAWKVRSKQPARRHSVKLVLHVDQTETRQQWERDLLAMAADESVSDEEAFSKTKDWWRRFWERSHLILNSNAGQSDEVWRLGRNYQLFRYQLGCNVYGDYPTKFNGGLFTYDPSLVEPRRVFTPDWRAWGGGSFTAQNQRLVYWPMLKSGDFDMMIPQFEFYRRALDNATLRVTAYWGHEGCLFTEQMSQFGLPIACAWGWDDPEARCRRRGDMEWGVMVNGATRYHYESQLEFSYMILEYFRFTGADIACYMPFIERSVAFFDEHYQMRRRQRSGKPLDEEGKLVIKPSTSCESYRGAVNPTDLTAGLNACLRGLLELPDRYAPEFKKRYWREFLNRVPGYAFGEKEGRKIVKPARSWTRYQNCECPQFYPLFPFNRFALGKDDMTVWRDTWKLGEFPKGMVQSWHQDGIFFARMGMTSEAAEYNSRKMADSGRRFPSFWGPGHDWVPDHNWGGSGMIGLQEMLIQTDGRTVVLLPAWPKNWNAEFRLRAPYLTTVEGAVRNGELQFLRVDPPERSADLLVASPDGAIRRAADSE